MKQTPEISIIIPTLHERANLERLLPRVFDVLRTVDLAAEVVIVDDNSRDGTDLLCRELTKRYPLKLITRTNAHGLATAVLTGFQHATADVFVVMDADLSHPPTSIPALVDAVRSPFCDVAIGSRYATGGSVDVNWGWFRRLNSTIATFLARGLTNANDPLAGFFAIRRETVGRNSSLCPLGYKILLELIVRCDCRRVIEIPIEFRNRVVGKSKLSVSQQWQFIRQLAQLYALRYFGKSSAPGDSPTMKAPQRKSA